MKIGQLFLGLGALALIFALCLIGPYPNPAWNNESAWVTSSLMSLLGLFCIGLGVFVMAGEPIN